MYYQRAHLQTKKEYYKRLAQIKKTKWLKYHNLSEEDLIKSPYILQEDPRYEEEDKTKKIVKGEIRIQQKLRNRAAAQESRQRHRCYVAELEKKVKIYEEMLEKQGALCKNCKKSLLSQTNIQNETLIAQDFSDHSQSLKFFNTIESQNDILNSFLNDQIIRIDNKNASTPFGIFFIICLIGVLAVFGMSSGSSDMTPSLLANYQSTINHHIQMQNMPSHQKYHVQLQPSLLQVSNAETSQKQQKSKQQQSLDSLELVKMVMDYNTIERILSEKSNDISVESSLNTKQELSSQQKDPQLLLLKTIDKTNESETQLITKIDLNQNQNINNEPKQKIEVIKSQSLRESLE